MRSLSSHLDKLHNEIHVETEKKIGNDVVFGPGLGTMDSGTKTAIENLTGYAPTKSFIELKVQWRKTTVSYCPLPSMPGEQ